jgi:hypothetical protein
MHHGVVTVVIGSKRPVREVIYGELDLDTAPLKSGFTVVYADAPEEIAQGDETVDAMSQSVCHHCLVNDYPEVVPGLDLAREHGSATHEPETGMWVASMARKWLRLPPLRRATVLRQSPPRLGGFQRS